MDILKKKCSARRKGGGYSNVCCSYEDVVLKVLANMFQALFLSIKSCGKSLFRYMSNICVYFAHNFLCPHYMMQI